jgi:hypothetical protein
MVSNFLARHYLDLACHYHPHRQVRARHASDASNTNLLSLSHFAEIDATCYLVMMIVFITPTANNVMIMVELSGSSSKVSRPYLYFLFMLRRHLMFFVIAP